MATKPSQIHDIDIDDSENISCNHTDNLSLRDVVTTGLSLRNILKGLLSVAAAGYLAPAPALAFGKDYGTNGRLLGFAPLTTEQALKSEGKIVTVSSDYEYQVLIPWGSRINPRSDVREYHGEPDRRPTAAEQEGLVGIGHDGMWFYPRDLPFILRI